MDATHIIAFFVYLVNVSNNVSFEVAFLLCCNFNYDLMGRFEEEKIYC